MALKVKGAVEAAGKVPAKGSIETAPPSTCRYTLKPDWSSEPKLATSTVTGSAAPRPQAAAGSMRPATPTSTGGLSKNSTSSMAMKCSKEAFSVFARKRTRTEGPKPVRSISFSCQALASVPMGAMTSSNQVPPDCTSTCSSLTREGSAPSPASRLWYQKRRKGAVSADRSTQGVSRLVCSSSAKSST